MVLDVVQKLRGFYDNSPNGKGRGRKGRKSAGGANVEEESQDVGNEDEAKKGKEKGFRVVLQNDKSLKEDKVSLVLRVGCSNIPSLPCPTIPQSNQHL